MRIEKDLVIVGASGHGAVVLDAFLTSQPGAQVCFADDDCVLWGQQRFGRTVVGSVSEVLLGGRQFHLAIGSNKSRARLSGLLNADYAVTVVHPAASVSVHSTLGRGVFVAAASVIAASARIGSAVIINHGAIVDHDCRVGDFSHIAPNATLGGGVEIGRGVLVGSGAVVLPGVHIGDDAVVAAGAVVTKHIRQGVVAIGVPARVR